MEKPIFDGPLLKMSSSRFQLNAPFSQNTGVYTRIFENAAIFIRVVVVLRLRAIARALTACTCADVIQPCRQPVIWSMAAMWRDSTVVVAAVVRTRPRAIPLAMITMRKSTHGFPFFSHIWVAYGAPLSLYSYCN